jgi:SAM-dependent methyltransferase
LENKAVVDFWDGLASGNYRSGLVGWYDEHNDDPNEALILFKHIEYLHPSVKTGIALDFGCGPGRNMIKFKNWFERIDGVDISSVVLEKAKLDLTAAGLSIPNLYLTNGHSIPDVPSDTYDTVFSIICMQHISCRDWRLELYREFLRVLKPGGVFTFQMGFGSGHPISKDYFYNYEENEPNHHDTRVESVNHLRDDLEAQGFVDFSHEITDPCHDQHPKWIWVQVRKPV